MPPEPKLDDNVLDNIVTIPNPDNFNKENNMAAVPPELHEPNLGRIAGAGASAHEHFVQFGKILDLAYESDRKMVSLVESLGVRESTSRSGQEGIPGATK